MHVVEHKGKKLTKLQEISLQKYNKINPLSPIQLMPCLNQITTSTNLQESN